VHGTEMKNMEKLPTETE